MAADMHKFQQDTTATIQGLVLRQQDLETQVGQLANKGRLPSQTETNPRAFVNAITLRSGKEVRKEEGEKELADEEELEQEQEVKPQEEEEQPNPKGMKWQKVKKEKAMEKELSIDETIRRAPFPSRFLNEKRKQEEKETLEIFKKVHVNIPLLEVIRQIPKYAKFLKDWCTNKRRMKLEEPIEHNVSAILHGQLPEKCKDPGSFSIPCMIGDVLVESAMLDLGASINVMPYSIYASLGLGSLKPTKVVLHLADKSIVRPRGVLEDVLVKVKGLVFPADFFVIDIEGGASKADTMLLGRPFMNTAKTKIDVHGRSLTMEFDDTIIKFDMHDTMAPSKDIYSIYQADVCHVSDASNVTNVFMESCSEGHTEKVASWPKSGRLEEEELNELLAQERRRMFTGGVRLWNGRPPPWKKHST